MTQQLYIFPCYTFQLEKNKEQARDKDNVLGQQYKALVSHHNNAIQNRTSHEEIRNIYMYS